MVLVTWSLAETCMMLCGLALQVLGAMTECEPGWFGSNCQHKCLCTGSQCNVLGQCTGGSKCKPGYFGPSCQYGDVVQLTSRISDDVPLWLMDGDDATCNDDHELQSVTIKFRKAVFFSWFRICLRHTTDSMNSFKVKLNDNLSCPNLRSALADGTTIDVHCDVDAAVHKLVLEGPAIMYLCSLYVSLGRSLVSRDLIGQAPFGLNGKMRTTLITNNVDRDRSVEATPGARSCSQQHLEKLGRSWSYNFDTAQAVSSVVLTSRNASHSQWITLKTFSSSGQLVASFEAEDYHNQIYFVSPGLVSTVTINAQLNESLSLCDVFIFGEVQCPEDTYGLDCNSACDCPDKRHICFTVTGKCADPCPIGFYGFNCSVPCPGPCRMGACSYRDGNCLVDSRHSVHGSKRAAELSTQSVPGACSPGRYGKNCKEHCPVKCAEGCNPVNGVCVTCSLGYFGFNCSYLCEEQCLDQDCYQDTGNCKDCEKYVYGGLCQYDCEKNCYNSECNSTTGKCDSCASGYKGDKCEQASWNVALFIILLFLIPSVIACFFCCEVFSEDSSEDQNKGSFTLDQQSTIV